MSMDSASQTANTASMPHAQPSKLAALPLALFASVMGFVGLGLAFKKAAMVFSTNARSGAEFDATQTTQALDSAQSLWHYVFYYLGFGSVVLGLIIFSCLLVCYIGKIIKHFDAFKGDITHQVKINFLSTIPIGALLLVAYFGDMPLSLHAGSMPESTDSAVASPISFWLYLTLLVVFYLAAALQLGFSLYVMRFWFKNPMKMTLLSPAWFIPIVGNLIVPVSGVKLLESYELMRWQGALALGADTMQNPLLLAPPTDMLLFFFSIGCFFWLILCALVMGRLIFEQSLESKFIPTLFIFIAPPSVFVLDFALLFGSGALGAPLVLMVYYIALFFALLLLALSKIFLQLGFAPSWWAFTFPLCAFSLASFECGYVWLGFFALFGAFCAVMFVGSKTLQALANGSIFKE